MNLRREFPDDPSAIDYDLFGFGADRSLDLVRRQAAAYSNNTFVRFFLLRNILEQHEATIQKRWIKKTRQQRLQIILEAWPSISTSHRPDLHAFRKDLEMRLAQGIQDRAMSTKFRNHYIWPYINQEDLSQPKLMLLLINTRGRKPPPVFAVADYDAMHLGKVAGTITPIHLNYYTMILNGVTKPEEYGRLLDWESHPDASDWVWKKRQQFFPGEGLLILEAQDHLMSFLVKCCCQILHDIPQVDLFNDARKLEAEDHVWSLREDPTYFAEQFREIQDHRHEMLPDIEGKPHPVTRKLRENALWARVTFSMLLDAYANLETLTELHRQAQNIANLHKGYEKIMEATNEEILEYTIALVRFKYYLEQACKAPMDKLKISVAASPPMRKFFVRLPPLDSYTSVISVEERADVKMDAVESYLIWLLQMLWEDNRNLFLLRLPNIVDELERLLQAEPKADALISAHVAKTIGELAILTQCLKQILLYQPWAQQYFDIYKPLKDNLTKEFTALKKPMLELHCAFLHGHLNSAARMGEPSGGKFTYPYSKRRTKETVNALRQAEANLDMFWAEVDIVTKAKITDFEDTALHRLLTQPRTLRRTPEWVEPAKKSEGVDPSSEKDICALNQPISNLFLGQSEETGQNSSSRSVQSKTKVKTKGEASQVSNETFDAQPDNVPDSEAADNQPTFAVDARVLKVFRTLFFNPEVISTPGSISWHDFLYAMASTSFQIEKLYGSVRQFSPTSLDVERGIHFHEPHPIGKIPFEVARRHG
ncbi:hypothetical protein DER45DRAFT_650125 [Fusarium avenaceum]|nr:hypothetical protein DER45DRAFT_650125 [Fusarium avenaceum]